MVRYFYAWTPLAIVATVVFLSLPWLGLIALMIVSLATLAALVFAVVFLPYLLVRAIGRHWHGTPRTAPALSRAEVRVRSVPAAAAVMFATSPSRRRRVS
jgi:hypothetical protein